MSAPRKGGRRALGAEDTVIRLCDDGSGFPFEGHFEHEELVVSKLGPRGLKNRVMRNRGRIGIDSSPSGTGLTIWLPNGTLT